MPKFAIEIKTDNFVMESKDFNTKEEALKWLNTEFKIAVGVYDAELIEYDNFNIIGSQSIKTNLEANGVLS
jgi:NADPH-dependent 7-cyano-7-deazaguanine reductase QueF-like protein